MEEAWTMDGGWTQTHIGDSFHQRHFEILKICNRLSTEEDVHECMFVEKKKTESQTKIHKNQSIFTTDKRKHSTFFQISPRQDHDTSCNNNTAQETRIALARFVLLVTHPHTLT